LIYYAWLPAQVLAAGASSAVDEPLRQQCVDVLRRVLDREERWVKVHAAEYLLALDYPEGVWETFQKERDLHEQEAEYRIGIWRVLARAAVEERRASQWIARIRDVFLDPQARDRLHAMESLAKLGYQVPPAQTAPFVEAAAGSGQLAAFARWVLVNSKKADAEQRLAEFVDSPDLKTRTAAAYAFSRLASVSPVTAATLLSAAQRESVDSTARVYLVAAAARHSHSDDRQILTGELRRSLRTGTPQDRRVACEALAGLALESDLPLLTETLSDSDADLASAAACAVLRIGRRVPHRLGLLDWAVIVVYCVGMLAVGWYYWRRNDTSEDYLLGGRRMKSLPVGLSLFATLFSTISYLAWPGEMIKYGPMILSIAVAYPFVALVAGRFLIPHFMQLRITSAYEILEVQLGLSIRLLGSTLFLLLRILWMSVIIYATVGAILVPLMGLDSGNPLHVIPTCVVLGIVTLIYTAMGGLRAVVVTDVLQGLILFAGAIAAIIAVSIALGGVGGWWPTSWVSHWTEPHFYDPNVRVTFVGAMVATFTWYISTAGSDQMAIQRYLATRDASAARGVLNTSLVANTLVFLLLAGLGLALLAYFQANPQQLPDGQTLVSNADQLFARFFVIGLPPGVSGLVVAGLLAAAMSSLSAGINSSCSVITVDFIQRFRRLSAGPASQVGGAWLEKVISVLIGIVMVLLSSLVGSVHGNLLEIAYKVVNLLSAPLFGLFFMALFVRWATPFGTWIGALAGLTVVIAVNYWQEITGTRGISFLWAMPLSFLAQVALGSLVSLLPIGRRAG
jgi:SSS family solute:Na+ symporter